MLIMAGCWTPPEETPVTDEPVVMTECAPVPIVTPELPTPSVPQAPSVPWTQDELDALALTLSGECYDHKAEDKRRVCEVILNRVSAGNFGSSVLEVVSAENQFNGYWTQSRPVSLNDYEIAEQALRDWYGNGREALSEYLFFSAGDNFENQFREEY